jgi:phosphosulfolactate phosphohydrolase-like enzyme
MSTTNGTIAITAASAGAAVIVATWLIFQAWSTTGADRGRALLLCAGRELLVTGWKDAVCAGQLAAAVMKALPDEEWMLNDARWRRWPWPTSIPTRQLFSVTAAGRSILEAGLATTMPYCARSGDLRDAGARAPRPPGDLAAPAAV